MKNNRRKASNRVKQPDTISALIEKQNIWSEWSAGCWIGPLSWVQMAALLMRDTQPEMIVNRSNTRSKPIALQNLLAEIFFIVCP